MFHFQIEIKKCEITGKKYQKTKQTNYHINGISPHIVTANCIFIITIFIYFKLLLLPDFTRAIKLMLI